MAIVNRSLDASEQRKIFQARGDALATGASGVVVVAPWPCTIDCGEIAAFGISGSPQVSLVLNRFIVGAGATAITIAVGTSNVPSAYGTSGPFAMVLPASGSTLLSLLANDCVQFLTAGSNAAVTGLCISLALKPTQDIKVNHDQV